MYIPCDKTFLFMANSFDPMALTVIFDIHLLKEHGSLPHHIGRTLTARRICLGLSISSILI